MDRRKERRGEEPQPRQGRGRKRRGAASERARRRQRALLLFYLFTLILVIAAAVVLCLTVLFQIDTIEVTGTSRYSQEEIISNCGIQKGDNLFLAKTDEAEALISEKLPYVGQVSVSRGLPAKIKIHVESAEVSGAMEYNGGYVIVSTQGKALEQVADKPQDIPVFLGVNLSSAEPGKQIAFSDENTRDLFYDLADSLSANGLDKVTVVDITNQYQILVEYDGRITLNLGVPEELDYKIRFGKAVIEQELTEKDRGELDLSNFVEENKAYFDEEFSDESSQPEESAAPSEEPSSEASSSSQPAA